MAILLPLGFSYKNKNILRKNQKTIAKSKKVWYNTQVVSKARWSSGQDASLSRWKHGFDSRTGHQQKKHTDIRRCVFLLLILYDWKRTHGTFHAFATQNAVFDGK